MVEPSIDFPRWLLLALLGIMAGLATALSDGRWLRFAIASTVGTFAGMCSGFALFPSEDGIANSYAPFVVIAGTLLSLFVSLFAGFAGRKLSVSSKNHSHAVWLVLICCVGFGPVALGLTSPLVAHRVARNDQLAQQRFDGLKVAVQRTMAENSDSRRICDGSALKRRYSGPPFSEEDWQRVSANYVKQDGYFFMLYCHEQGGYTIHAIPWAGKGEGTRQFCTDESGKVRCRMEWNRSRHVCTPCAK